MNRDIKSLAREFHDGKPFPHLMIDDFFTSPDAEAALAAFPAADNPLWTEHGRVYNNPGNALKYEMPKYEAMPPALQRIVDIVNSPENISFVEQVTGITGLMPDHKLYGGGLNLVPPGGFLRVHSDFNYSNELQSYRTINLLVYLNKNWLPEYNGGLELWDPKDMAKPKKVLEPLFNRVAIFTTTSDTPHGYSVIKCPDTMARKSLNFYYYKKEPVEGVAKAPHRTLWIPD